MDIVSCSLLGGDEKRYGLIYVDLDDEGNGSGKRYRKGQLFTGISRLIPMVNVYKRGESTKRWILTAKQGRTVYMEQL